ncbi:hemagglutinin repeat-containing protein [Xanthomonas sacchari]|uniref:hemagglutinin repeat-containing protein n=2 Tax=Xanthomonas TaxID=338 RepID=UPI00225659C1|nr:hemagglutinin repeat-containing protein [Xanthomonas sacchari]
MDRNDDRRHRLLEPLKRGLAALLCCTVTWTSLPLYAQVAPVANPDGRQPGQQAAANGVPVVDIVAPNARGVSHNRYSRFDVGSNGLILNNSAQISKTELGGYIAGNDNLKNSGAATLILNEVTSTTSRLQGYTEIAGAKAQLVIANPNGIVCDGCGFLNTSRVTLATGTPLLGADGALNGFSITGGALSIGSNGLDAYNVDRLDLLSRQLSVGGSVWAKDLLASAGAQRIGYDGMLLEVLPGSDGAPPAIGIDVAYLGGMYADRIRLIATEAGVGVVSRGTLSAQSGSLQIDSAGQLSLAGTAVARDDVDLRAAGALSQQGVLGSQQAGVRLRAAQLALSGDTIAHGLLDAAASGALAHSGRSSAGAITLFGSELDAGGSLYSGGDLALSASGELRSSGSAYAGGAAQLQAGAAWLQQGGTVQSAGSLAVQAARIDAAGVLDAGAGLRLRSDADMRLSGLAQSWQDASAQAGGRLDTLGQLSAGGRLDLGAAAIGNAAGAVVSAGGDVALATPGALDNAGTLYAGRDLRIDAASVGNSGGSYAGRNATLASTAALNNSGSLVAGAALSVDAAQLRSSGELGSQGGDVALRSRGDLALAGQVAAKGALTAQAGGALLQSGTLGAGSAQLQAAGDATLDGVVRTDGDLQLSADGQLRSSATLAAGGNATLHAQGALLQSGQVQTGGALALDGASIAQAGVLDAGTTLALRSVGDLSLAGTVQSRGDLALSSAAALQNQAQVVAGGALSADASSLSNAAGASLSALGDASLSSATVLSNDGHLYAGGALGLRAASLTQTGSANAGTTLTLSVDGAVANQGDLVGGGDVQIDAGSLASSGQLGSQHGQVVLNSRGDVQLDGVVVAAGALNAQALGDLQQRGSLRAAGVQLAAAGDLGVAGTVQSTDALQLQAQRALRVDGQASASGAVGVNAASVALGNGAILQSATALQVDTAALDSQGTLDAGTDLRLHSTGDIHLAGIAQAGRDVAVLVGGTLDNQAKVFAGRALQLTAASARNQAQGQWLAQTTLDANVQGNVDNAGLLQAGQAATLTVGSLQQSGRSYAGDTLTVQAATALTNSGDLIGKHDVAISAGSVTSSGQLGSQDGQLGVVSAGDLQVTGTQIAGTVLRLQAAGDLLHAGTSKAQSVQLEAGRDLSMAGTVQSASTLQAQAQHALQLDGQALAGGSVQLRGASVGTGSAAVLQSTAAIAVDGGSIDSRGALDAGTDLTLHSQDALRLAGIAQGGNDVRLTAAGAFDNSARVVAGRDLQVQAASAVNRAAGTLAAGRGLDLHVDGLLDNAGLLRGEQSLQLQAGSVQHGGTLSTGQALTLRSSGAMDNRGNVIAGGDLLVDVGSLSNSGQLGSQNGQVTLTSQGDLQLGGSVIAAQALNATALGDLRLDGVAKARAIALSGRDVGVAGGLQSATNATLQAQRALRIDGQALTTGDLQLQGASVATGNAAVLQSTAGAITLQGGSLDSRGTLDAATDLALRSDGTLAVAGVAQAGRDVALAAGTQLTNAAQVLAGRDLSVAATGIANAQGGSLAAKGALALTTAGTLANAGTLQSGQAMTLQVGDLQHSGQAYAGDTLSLRASGAIDSQGELIAKRDLQLDAGRIASTGQLGSQSGQVALTSQGDLTLGGTVAAASELSAQAQGDLLQTGTLSAQALDLRAGRDLSLGGQLATTQELQAQAQRDLQVNGSVSAGRDATLQAGGTLRGGSQSVLHSAGALQLNGTAIDSQGTVDAGTTLAMTSTGDLALGGLVQAASTLDLRATGALTNAAQLVAGSDLSLTAASATNSGSGTLAALGNATFTVSGLLSNAGALRARQRLQLDVGSLQQTGRSYGVQRLALTANGAVDNRGDLIAGSALRVQAASVASSGQLGSETGDVALVSQGDLNLGGTLASAGGFSAQAGGALNQSGALSAATTLQLQAHGDLTVAGTLNANQVVLGSDAAVLQRGVVSGADIALQGQRIDNAGQTLSSGNLRLSGGNVAIGGVAAAGVRADGSLGNSGALTLHADGTLSASGRLIAAGNLAADAAQLALAGSTARVGGNATLTASGDVDHRGADLLAGGLLTVRAGGALDNSALNGVGGTLQAAGLDLGAATLRNGSGSLVQSGSGTTRIAVTRAFDNGGGRLVSNGSDLQLGAASINNAQGRIEHAGSGTLTVSSTGALGNAGGRILTQGHLQLSTGNTLDNQGGAIAAAGDASVTAAGLGNIGGSVSARGLNVQLGNGALDNRLGVVQATGGSLVLRADSLENRGGTMQALSSGGAGGDLRVDLAHTLNNDAGVIGASTDLTLNAENASNSGGTLQAGRDLALTARGQLDNHQSGRIGAARDLSVAVTGALLNSGGQLDSGNAMTLSGGRIDNSQGSVVNNGGGLTRLTTGGELRNVGSSLGGRGSVVLDAASIANGSGQLVAGGDLVANTNALDNQGGSVYAGASMLLQRSGATLDNRNGKIKAEQAVRLNLQSLSNSGGQIGAGSSAGGAGDVVIDTVGFDGGGSILGQNLLDLTIRSDYTHRAGADITSNGDFRLAVGGNFVNASALQAGRSLGINASSINNVAGASMRSGNVQLNTGGSVSNAGDLSASGNLQVTAGSVSNTGSLVGGNVLVDTGTLVNGADLGGATDNAAYGSALIGATSGMTLLVRDQLVNRDAKIFSLGNIAIGAARDGNGTLTARTGTLDNVSGSIEADGSILVAANQINNRRRVLSTQTGPLSDADKAAANAAMPSELIEGRGIIYPNQPYYIRVPYQGPSPGVYREYSVEQRERLIAASAEGRIAAGGNIALSGSVTNNASTIAAAGALMVNQRGVAGLYDGMVTGSESVANQALALKQQVVQRDVEHKVIAYIDDCAMTQVSGPNARKSPICGYNRENNVLSTTTVDSSYIALAANMTGGQGVSISGATISNGAVGSDGRSIGGASFNATQGGALNRYGTMSADGAGGIAVQAQTAATPTKANVGNRIATASLGAIRIDDGQATLVGGSSATASQVQASGVQAQLGGAGSGGRSQVQAGTAQAVLTAGSVPTQYQQIDPGTGQVPQVVGGVGAPLGNIVLPMGGLYRLVGSSGASVNTLGRAANGLGGVKANNSAPGRRYLIETDPRFVDYNNFISSDYLLDKLGVDPQWTQTRLGDGFYEQRLVLDQITQLTGRRYLGNYADGVAQYRALLDGGVAEAGTLHLSVGVALTADQVAALTHDIVWMVEQEYQGQKVLVPVVYLSSKTALTLRSDGALLASDNGDVSLNATAGLSNTGTIGGANVSANVGNLLNQGRIVSSGTVQLQANQDLLNLGGQIAGRDVLLSAGRDLTSTTRDALAGGDLRSGITADNNLLLQAGRDLSLTGTTVQAGNSAALLAGNNLTLQPTALRNDGGLMRGGDGTSLTIGNNLSLQAGNDLQLHGVAIAAGGDAALQAGHDLSLLTPVTDANGKATVRTSIATGGSLQLAAGNDLTIRQAQIKADGNLIAAAGHDLNVTSVLGDSRTVTDQSRQGKTRVVTTTTTQDIDQQALTAGGNLVLSAGHDVNLTAAKLDAGSGLAVVAGNDLNSTTLTTVDSSSTLETRKRFKQTTSTRDETVHGTEFTAGGDIALQSGRDVNLTAANLFTDKGALAVSAGNDVNLLTEQEQHDAVQDMQKKKKGFLSSKTTTTHDEWHDSLAVGTSLDAGSVQIKAGNDIAVVGSTVLAQQDARLVAGNDVAIVSAQDQSSEAHSSAQKKSGFSASFSGGVASLGYGKSRSSSDSSTESTTQVASAVGAKNGNLLISAGDQLTIGASDVAAGKDLTLAAKDIALLAAQDTVDNQSNQSSKSSGFSIGVTYDPAAAYRSARDAATSNMPDSGSTMGKLSRRAEGDTAGTAAALTPVVIQAGSHRSNANQNDSTSTARVSQVSAGGNLTLLASDGSITSQGTQLSAEGNALLLASQNIDLGVAHTTESSGNDSRGKGWSFNNAAGLPFGNYNQKGNGTGQTDTITGTQLSVGGNASLSTTQGDITLTASNIAAQGDVTMHAAGDLTIQSGQDTAGNANVSDNKAIGTVVISDTERFSGYHTEKHRDDNATVTQVASSVGSLGGNVNLSAGGTYTQSASNVVAAKDVDVTAASIQLLTANDSHAASSQDDTLKIGAFARVKSPLIDLINNVDAARNSDGRLSAMQGMAALANGYQTASAISGVAQKGGSGVLVQAEAGVGYATSTEAYKAGSQTAQASTISGGGNVSLTSTKGDLHVVQGNLKAGDTLRLDAARDLVLEAGNSTATEQSKGSNAGVEVGVGVSVGAKTGYYAYLQANFGSHSSNVDGATWKNTELAAQNISLTSKGDTTLRGAVAKADRIDVQTGGDLTIESLQDTANVQSKESGYGGRIQVAIGSAWDLSGYASTAKANGNSTGVTEQSGLFAGKGGYHVDAGNVNLVGGAIASTNAGNSELTATSLTFSDLQNRMGYSASSGSVSGGFGSSGDGGKDANGNPTSTPSAGDQLKDIKNTVATGNYGSVNNGGLGGGLPMSESGKDSTTTRATLTEGKLVIGGKTTTAAQTGINTDASKANEALATLPDVRKVLAEQQAMGAAAGTVLETSRQVAGDIAASAAKKTAEARDAYLKGLNSDEQEAFAKLDPTAQQNVLLSQSTAYSDAYAKEKQWGTGGEYNRALQAVTTALVGGVSGQGGTQVASNALAPYAAQLIGQTFDTNHGSDPNKSLQLLSHALLGAVLAEANGSSAVGGALTGAGGEAAAQYLTKTLYGADTKPSDLSEQDKQTILALSQAVGALVGGMTGGSLSDTAVGSTVARNAVENNFLGDEQKKQLDALRAKSKTDGLNAQEARDLVILDVSDQVSDGLLQKYRSGEQLTPAQMQDLRIYLGAYAAQNGADAAWGLIKNGSNPNYGFPYAGLSADERAYGDANFTWRETLFGHDKSSNEQAFVDARNKSGLYYNTAPNESLTPSGLQFSSNMAILDTLGNSVAAGLVYIGASYFGASDRTRDALTFTVGQLAEIGSSFVLPKTGISPIFGQTSIDALPIKNLPPISAVVDDEIGSLNRIGQNNTNAWANYFHQRINERANDVPLQTRTTNGVDLDYRLPDPAAGLDYTPKLLSSNNPSIANSHQNGYVEELRLANTVANLPDQVVVKYGDAVGAHGADVVSVNVATGEVTLWDNKFRSGSSRVGSSPTFSENSSALEGAIDGSIRDIRNSNLPLEVKEKAVQNLLSGNFTANTVGSGSAKNSETAVFRGNKVINKGRK